MVPVMQKLFIVPSISWHFQTAANLLAKVLLPDPYNVQ